MKSLHELKAERDDAHKDKARSESVWRAACEKYYAAADAYIAALQRDDAAVHAYDAARIAEATKPADVK